MKKNRANLFTACILALSVFSTQLRAVEMCKGGEGGTPFANITKEFQVESKLMHTHGLIKDFQVGESKQQLVYRDENNLIWKSNAQGQQPIDYMLTPFSRILDAANDFVVAKDSPWALNTKNQNWYSLGKRQNEETDLYWNSGRIFSLENTAYAKNTVKYNIHHLNGRSNRMSCTLSFPSNVEMHYGTGHTYPFLFIYTTEKLEGGVKVTKYNLRLEAQKKLIGEIPRCELTFISEYNKLMPGDIKGLHHFGNLNDSGNSAWIMEIDHPLKRLLWSYKEQCIYFNAPPSPLLIPNPKVPVVAMQKEGGGLTLIYPGLEKSVDLMEKTLTRPLSSEDLWITKDKKNLYIATQPENENARVLFKLMLDKVQ